MSLGGTPSYMAPEAFDRKRNVLTDIWSVGVILYEMLNGVRPFPYDNLTDLVAAIIKDEPAPFSGPTPIGLRDIVLKSLAKSPMREYLNALDFRDALAKYLALVDRQSYEKTWIDDGDSLQDSQGHIRVENTDKALHVPRAGEQNASRDGGSKRRPFPGDDVGSSTSGVIGRSKEISEITALLRRDDVQLVTMTGVGGTGKTTLDARRQRSC